MSHYAVLVVVDHADSPDEAIRRAEEELDPFSEHLDVDEHFEIVTDADQCAQGYAKNESENDPRPEGVDATEYAIREWTARAVGWSWMGDPDVGRYDEDLGEFGYMTSTNPNGRWDWYEVGGRWRGYFKVCEDAGQTALGEFDSWKNGEREIDGRADVLRVKAADLDGMRDEDAEEAAKVFDTVAEATAGLDPAPDFDALLEEHGNDVAEARRIYNSHPRVAAISSLEFSGKSHWSHWLSSELPSREEYVERARQAAVTPWAVVVDGEWVENNDLSWLGSATNEQTSDWNQRVNELLSGLNPDAWLVLVDCHS